METMPWYIPLLIFCARICDVSLGTMRTVMVVRGRRVVAAGLGFVEVTIWILAVSGALMYLRDSLWAIFGYAAGFSVGTLVGMWLEEVLAIGHQTVRAINPDSRVRLAAWLRQADYRVTEVEGHGVRGPVEICFIVAPRRKVPRLVRTILDFCPDAFITVEDLRDASTVTTRQLSGGRPPWMRILKVK